MAPSLSAVKVLQTFGILLMVSSVEARWLPRFLLEWPEAAFMPTWLSLPWGPVPDWGLVHRTLECRGDMRKTLAAVQKPCTENSNEPACRIRIKLVSLHAHEYIKNQGGMFEFARVTTELKAKYCQRWKSCESTILMEPKFDAKYAAHERAPAWSKVLAVLGEIQKGDCDWYMWMDGDSAFIDHAIDLRFLIARVTMPEYGGNADKTFLISHDIWHTPGDGASNTGVWLIKNGTDSIKFLQELWEVPDKVDSLKMTKKDHPWEQRAYNEHMWGKYSTHIERLDECWLFGHPLSLVDQPFIAHLCGIPSHHKQNERLRYFSFWNDRIKL